MNGKPVGAAFFNSNALLPGDGMAHSRLRTGWCNHYRFTEFTGGGHQCVQAGSFDSVVIGDQEFHRLVVLGIKQRRASVDLILMRLAMGQGIASGSSTAT